MDLLILILVVAVICFLVQWITTNLVTNPTAVTLIWFVTIVVLLLYGLRQLGIVIPNVIR